MVRTANGLFGLNRPGDRCVIDRHERFDGASRLRRAGQRGELGAGRPGPGSGPASRCVACFPYQPSRRSPEILTHDSYHPRAGPADRLGDAGALLAVLPVPASDVPSAQLPGSAPPSSAQAAWTSASCRPPSASSVRLAGETFVIAVDGAWALAARGQVSFGITRRSIWEVRSGGACSWTVTVPPTVRPSTVRS
jgi:hypothetical protein